MSDLQQAFDEAGDALLPRRLRVTALAAGLVIMGFTLVDLFVLPGPPVLERFLIRLAFTPVYLFVAGIVGTSFGRRHARWLAVGTSAAIALDLAAVAVLFPSRESVGFFPAMIFLAAMLPMPRRWLWSAQVMHPLAFFTVHGAMGLLARPEVLRFGGNIALATLVAMAAVYLAEGLRRSEFAATSRLAEANRRLLELDKVRAQFVAEMSHELRTPLSAALLALEADATSTAHGALRPLRRLRGLVEELLEISRIDAGVVRPDGLATHLPGAVHALADDFRGAFEASRVRLRVEASTHPETLVPMGATALDRILVNLLGHALRRAQEGSEVLLRVGSDDQNVTLEVIDQGPTIASEQLPYVFERFFSGPRPLREGIGLALSRELIELHRGSIECESVPERTVVRARWARVLGPADVPNARSERAGRIADAVAIALDGRPPGDAEVADDEQPKNLSRPLVLIVESHAQLALRIAETLRPDCRTLVAPDGEACLARLAETTPDLIVTDLRLEHMDGLELLRRLRSNEHTRLTPVLVLSAVADKEHLVQAMRAGADDIMAKPFDRELLRARADTLLRLKRRRDERAETRRMWAAACDAMGGVFQARVSILRQGRSGRLKCVAATGDKPDDQWGDAGQPWLRALVESGARGFEPGALAVPALSPEAHAIAAPMARNHQLLGLIVAARPTPFSSSELEALAACARYARLRLERDEHFGHLARSADERRRLLSAMLVGQDGERDRLARDLHDGTGQVLIAAALHLDLALQSPDEATLRHQLSEGRALVDAAVDELRALSRDLHPPTLTQFGLAETLRVLARNLSSDRLEVATEVDPSLTADLRAQVAIGVYRIAQAALANVVRHARARRAGLVVRREADELVLEVADDGIGFNVTGTESGVGLLSIRERSESLGGRVEIDSVFGEGTRVRVTLPLDGRSTPALAA